MKIRYSQITITPGNPAKNFETCIAAARRAKAAGDPDGGGHRAQRPDEGGPAGRGERGPDPQGI